MDEKIYLDSNGLTRDSFALARKIFDSGFRPDVIIGLWRGGTPVAVAVQEEPQARPTIAHSQQPTGRNSFGVSRSRP